MRTSPSYSPLFSTLVTVILLTPKPVLLIIKDEWYIEIEWSCLDWNATSIEFYKKIGALQEKGRVYFGYKLNN